MELNEKLQELRKQRGLTQEELASSLYVSRTAISKWESGRGYPSIDSLKAIAAFFGVTIDMLLSGDELLTVAEEDNKQKEKHLQDVVFGLLDCSMVLFLFLPFFRQTAGEIIHAVSLLSLTGVSLWLRILYDVVILSTIAFGAVGLMLHSLLPTFLTQNTWQISFALNAAGTLLFIASQQPYAAAFSFVFLLIKVFLLVKKP